MKITTDSDSERMMQMITGYWVTQIVRAAAIYSVADHLANGPATAAEIARAEGTNPSAMFRLMRACASLALLTYEGESFAATPLLETLRKDNPQSLRGTALALGSPVTWLPWGRFPEAVKEERAQAVPALGMQAWEYLARNPTEANLVARAMVQSTAASTQEVTRILASRFRGIVVDVGGSTGMLLHAMLRANPALEGVVLDLPHVAESAKVAAAEAGLSQRVKVVGGDFFADVPPADLYLLRYILHDWNDEECIRILRNCRGSLRAEGHVAVIEHALGEIGEPTLVPLMDMNMMVTLTGRERSQSEYRHLLEAAGLRITNVFPTNTPSATILEAMAV